MNIQEQYENLEFEEFIRLNYSRISDDWKKYMEFVKIAFNADTKDKQDSFIKKMYLKQFCFTKMKEEYHRIIRLDLPMEDDILKFIAYLYGIKYFERIGNPTLKYWLNSKKINQPFSSFTGDNGYKGNSLLELTKFELGQNVIRNWLLSTLKW